MGEQIYAPLDPDDFDLGHKTIDERIHKLEQVALLAKMKLVYVYDFGDDWQHEVLVENALPVGPAARYAVCLDGARARPPEDCGGAPGQEGLLLALADSSHPRHQDAREWVGAKFDPEALDLEKIKQALARLR